MANPLCIPTRVTLQACDGLEGLLRVWRDLEQQEQMMDEAYQAYRSAAESPTIRLIWTAVYRDRLWESGAPPLTMATSDDVQFLTDRLAPKESSRLVDLGCGSGPLSRHLAGVFGSDVVGVDANPLAVRLAQEGSRDQPYSSKLTFETRDIAATGLPDNAFDGAASLDVLLFAKDKASVLREVRRILKPGARFSGTTWELRAPSVALSAPPFQDYAGAFEAAGFTVEVYEETKAWRPLLEGILAAILARDVDIAREVSPARHEGMRSWARRRPAELDDSRRTKFCVRKPQ